MIKVTLSNDANVRAMLRKIADQAARTALARTAAELETYIEGEAGKHNKTGALLRSVGMRKEGEAWIVGHDERIAPHALFVHWGTKPHKIKPLKKKALRWPSGDKFAFAKEVNHPGNAPDPWLKRAAGQAPSIFAKHVKAHLDSIIKG